MHQQSLALCCECGTVRDVHAHSGLDEAQSAHGHARCVVWRACFECGRRTYHACLRDDAERDELEQALHLDADLAAEALAEEVEQLRLCGVDIGHAPVPAIWDGQSVGMVTQRLSDHTYAVILDPQSSVVARLRLVDLIWVELCVDSSTERWHIQPPDQDFPGYAVRLFGYPATS